MGDWTRDRLREANVSPDEIDRLETDITRTVEVMLDERDVPEDEVERVARIVRETLLDSSIAVADHVDGGSVSDAFERVAAEFDDPESDAARSAVTFAARKAYPVEYDDQLLAYFYRQDEA